MPDNILAVLTFKSIETILNVGGTQSWALDKNRAKICKYAVVCRNANTRSVEGPEEHGHAFMIGKIKDVIPSTEMKGRWLVTFSEYAVGDFGKQWAGRNPVAYYTADEYESDVSEGYQGIDFNKLAFVPMPEPVEDECIAEGLTIAEAKAGLAIKLGIRTDAIEITIRA